MKTRQEIGIGVAAIAVIAAVILLFHFDSDDQPDRLGTVESWSSGFPFSEDQRAIVLASGFGDVRGIAYGAGDLILSEANGRVWKYSGVDHKLEEKKAPQAEPQKVDQRGAVVDGQDLFIAQHARGTVSIGLNADDALRLNGLTGPSGLAALHGTLFVTDDRPWPGAGLNQAFDSADYSTWIEKGTQRLFGGVFTCPVSGGSCAPVPVASRLRHPSGIAVDPAGRFLFVTESDSNQIRWVIFAAESQGNWTEAGALGSVSTAGETPPPFLGIAIDPSAHYIFAAGGTSVYVFSWPRARMLGRVVFDAPVTGIATHEKVVDLVAAHRLCRLTMDRQ